MKYILGIILIAIGAYLFWRCCRVDREWMPDTPPDDFFIDDVVLTRINKNGTQEIVELEDDLTGWEVKENE